MPYGNSHQTWVDKRGKTRQIPMKIISPSLSRSGTSSLRIALSDFGYTAYHGWSLLENPPDCILWQEAMKAKFDGKGRLYTKKDFDVILYDSE
jgi:Sulfotransferase domain